MCGQFVRQLLHCGQPFIHFAARKKEYLAVVLEMSFDSPAMQRPDIRSRND
jgi:hypothetical protein